MPYRSSCKIVPSQHNHEDQPGTAGRSKAEMFEGIKAAFDKKELPAVESGEMVYMRSRQGHLNDRVGHWHPHVMFLLPSTEAAA